MGQARAPKPRMRGGFRAIRGVFSFGDFSLDKQRKVTLGAGREHPAFKWTPPQAARHERSSGSPLVVQQRHFVRGS